MKAKRERLDTMAVDVVEGRGASAWNYRLASCRSCRVLWHTHQRAPCTGGWAGSGSARVYAGSCSRFPPRVTHRPCGRRDRRRAGARDEGTDDEDMMRYLLGTPGRHSPRGERWGVPSRVFSLARVWWGGQHLCASAMYRGGYGTQNRQQYNSSSYNQGYQVCFTTIVRSPRPLCPYRRVTHLSVPLKHGSTYLP